MKNVLLASVVLTAVLPLCIFTTSLHAQAPVNTFATADSGPLPEAPSPSEAPQQSDQGPKQTNRILGIIPNFRSVSADVKLPPQSNAQKLKTGLQDSFDYSSFIFIAAQAGVADASSSTKEFSNTGASNGVVYGRYFWHTFADAVDENLMVESLLPIATHEDSRFYTLGHGSYLKRGGYALSRAFVTRTDSGSATFNASEIVGAGAAAGISSLYYPSQERDITKVYQRWITSIAIDSVSFAVKEFWPDVNHAIFRQKN